jgi:hypothetical protein
MLPAGQTVLLKLAKYSDVLGHLCRSGFHALRSLGEGETPDMLGNPSGINPDLQSDHVTLVCETH